VGTQEIEVLLFAGAREAAGREKVRVEVPAPAAAAEVLAALRRQIPQLSSLIDSCRLAVDQRYAADADPVAAGQEVVLIPPVSGG
jgi:molybdopterin converting factor subunit 1